MLRDIQYNPRPLLPGLLSVLGVACGVVDRVWVPSPFTLALAGCFLVGSALLYGRYRFWTRVLTLEAASMVVPSGFLRLRPRRFWYVEVQSIELITVAWTTILRVRTLERDIEIQDLYLPDREQFRELAAFLYDAMPVPAQLNSFRNELN